MLVAVGALIPIIVPLNLPVSTSPPVEKVFNRIENELKPGDVIMLSFDYGPSSAPELDPMADAILRHCFLRKVKVLGVALFPLGGAEMGLAAFDRIAREQKAVYDQDYVNIGYKDGAMPAMKKMGEDIKALFPKDVNGNDTNELEFMKDIKNYNQIKLIVTLSTGIIGEWYANLVNAMFKIPVAVGTTAVATPKYYAFYASGQMMGLIGGLKGASEYEQLLKDHYPQTQELSASATRGMDVQSIVHLIIVGFIILGNIFFFLEKREKRRKLMES
ncbi:hypothetical protein KKB18_13365 [bacterium]|nr:hypothetical protein [bacterium]